MRTEFVDIHAHFLPADAVAAFGRPQLVKATGRVDNGGTAMAVLGKQVILPAALSDLDGLLADMERRGIAKRYLSIPPFLFLYELGDREADAWAAAYNDSIIELTRARPERLAPVATLPMGSPDAAVAELERVVRLGVRMVQLATNVLGRELGEDCYRPIFEALHRSGAMALLHPHYIQGRYGSNRFHLRNLVGNAFETSYSAAHLAASGVLDEFPGIRLCLSHGGGALPYLRGRLQRGGDVREDVPLADIDQVLRSFYYDSAVFSSESLDFLAAVVGADRIFYGTDFPFDMSDPLGPDERFAKFGPAVRVKLPRDLPGQPLGPFTTIPAPSEIAAGTKHGEEER
jgi:aminocarboxymuconate-semialdehyde decarboxylase